MKVPEQDSRGGARPAPGLRMTPAHAASLLATALLLACAVPAAPPASAETAAVAQPDWVANHGASAAHPSGRYLTGYGVASGDDALEQARQQAAADLARKILVRIESEVRDVSREANGVYTYELAAVTRSTTNVQLSGLSFAPAYERAGHVHVLAWLERGAASAARVEARERAATVLRACLAEAELEMEARRQANALRTLQRCRLTLALALQHEAAAVALMPSGARDRAAFEELVAAARRVDRHVDTLRRGTSENLETAAESLSLQLLEQGVSTRSHIVVPHFRYGATNLSSTFGRQAGLELERALARTAPGPPAGAQTEIDAKAENPARTTALAVHGVYHEDGDRLRLFAIAREVEDGRLVGSADASLPRAAVPARLEIQPANLLEVLETQRVLAGGELVSGALSVEVFTNKGRGGVLFTKNEELKILLRVNQPAWIRLIYVLTNGAKVPLDQGYYMGANMVNRVVEYPDTFVVQEPFGIEMLHATAFTQEPPQLATHHVEIAGHEYEVLADGLNAIVRTRGLARKEKQELAEDIVTVTTTPRF